MTILDTQQRVDVSSNPNRVVAFDLRDVPEML